jgi:hypothetical protein
VRQCNAPVPYSTKPCLVSFCREIRKLLVRHWLAASRAILTKGPASPYPPDAKTNLI